MVQTVPLTPKQRATLDKLHADIEALQGRVNVFITAIIQGSPIDPSAAAQIALTADGIQITEPEPPAPEA